MSTKVPPIRVRGIRQTLPSGYALGRLNKGPGPTELIPLKGLANALVETGGVASGSSTGGVGSAAHPSYEFLGFSGQGPFTTIQQFALAAAPRAVLFPSVAGSGKSVASATSGPAASFTCVLTDDLGNFLANGSHALCSVHFAANAKVGTFSYGGPLTIVAGKVLYLVMPAVADAALSGLQILFVGDPK